MNYLTPNIGTPPERPTSDEIIECLAQCIDPRTVSRLLFSMFPDMRASIQWGLRTRLSERHWYVTPHAPPEKLTDEQSAHGLQWCAYARGAMERCRERQKSYG